MTQDSHHPWNLTPSISATVAGLRTSTPEVMKNFSEPGRLATGKNALDAQAKELISLAQSVAVRCDLCMDFQAKALEEVGETLGVSTYRGRGPSLMYAASVVNPCGEMWAASARPAQQRRQGNFTGWVNTQSLSFTGVWQPTHSWTKFASLP
jgi:AhpD family alkylhydroperoxidase